MLPLYTGHLCTWTQRLVLFLRHVGCGARSIDTFGRLASSCSALVRRDTHSHSSRHLRDWYKSGCVSVTLVPWRSYSPCNLEHACPDFTPSVHTHSSNRHCCECFRTCVLSFSPVIRHSSRLLFPPCHFFLLADTHYRGLHDAYIGMKFIQMPCAYVKAYASVCMFICFTKS